MNNNMIITIGRETGSGGKHIGELIAAKLGIKCYDKELLDLAAKNSGLCAEIFETHDEKPTNSFLYSLVMDTYSVGYNTTGYMDIPLNQKVFLAQFDTIKKLAEEEPCVIVGRCADYALQNFPNVTSVFITGDLDDKLEHIAKQYNLTPDKAREFMVKTDKKRSGYYNYYSNKKWGSSKEYDMCINSSVLGHEGTADLIIELAKKRQELKK